MYLSIFFDYKEIHNNSSEALFLCLIRSWIIYKYIILCFQVFFRNWCDRNYIALMGVFFFNIFAVLYDVYVWCFTVNGDLACFFLLILQLLGSHLPSFLFLNQFYKLIYKFCCFFFFMFFVKLIWSFFCKVKSQWRNTIWY